MPQEGREAALTGNEHGPGSARRPTGSAGLRRAFSSLRSYNYRLYFYGQVVSMCGTWMQRFAQSWLVVNLTHSAVKVGLATTLQFLPITLFVLFGGVAADRIPKRRLLLFTQSASAVQAAALAILVATGTVQLWHIYVLAFALGLTNAIDGPVSQSFPVELVGREEVANAVALNSLSMNLSRIIGPTIAGIFVAVIGLSGCFWLNAVSFVAVIGALIAMKPQLFYAAPPRSRAGTLPLLKEGLRYARQTPAVFGLMIVLFFFGTFAFNNMVVFPLLAKVTLHTDARGYGFLFAATGVGSLAAALSQAYSGSYSQRMVFAGAAILAVSLVLLGLSHTYAISAFLWGVTGCSSILFTNAALTRLQIIVPDRFRGRVISLQTLFFQGTVPAGALLIGALADRWDPGAALVICAVLSTVGLALAWLYLRGRSPADLRRGTVFEHLEAHPLAGLVAEPAAPPASA